MTTTRAIVSTGILTGTLDGIAAIINFKLNGGGDPAVIARFIASGILGTEAFQGGVGVVILGIALHYLIAFTWTTLFYFIFPWVQRLQLNKYLLGTLFGVVISLMMNLVILPLSNTPPATRDLTRDLTGVLILIAAVGIPIALRHTAAYRERRASNE